jgi:hypothetical protein
MDCGSTQLSIHAFNVHKLAWAVRAPIQSALQLDYSYGTTNNNGNLQSQTITAPALALTQSYTYEELNRLKSAEEMNGGTQSWKQTFIYDRYGNRTFDVANTTIPVPLTNLVTNPLNNRFDSTAAGQSLISYDNA